MSQHKTIVLLLGLALWGLPSCEDNPFADTGPYLTLMEEEPAGDNCANGGIRVRVGEDVNDDGLLDSAEVTATNYVCHGLDGQDGADGADGMQSLVNVSNEPAGDHCPSGGVKIQSGLDQNGDGVLSEDEVTNTAFVCHGTDGSSSLINMVTEPTGEACEAGGIRITTGQDDNRNGILEPAEVANTAIICNGTPGQTSVIRTTSEAEGEHCALGGVKVEAGLDDNDNGILDDAEVVTTDYICNGPAGEMRLITLSAEEPGSTCGYGGIRVAQGYDENANGTLDSAEIHYTEFVCNQITGAYDREVVLQFPGGGVGYGGRNVDFWHIVNNNVVIHNFDLNNYPGIDSVSFGAYIGSNFTEVEHVQAWLYDDTNGTRLYGSLLATDLIAGRDTDYFWNTSSINFLHQMPRGLADLKVAVRREGTEGWATIFAPELRLYRRAQ